MTQTLTDYRPIIGFSPSRYQEDLFEWGLNSNGHAVVSATAGSGKTSSIVALAKLLQDQRERSILFCAFNKSIAEELASRLPRGARAATLHSVGMAALRSSLSDVKLKVDGYKYADLARDLLADEGILPRKHKDYAEILDCVSSLVDMARVNLTDYEDSDALEELADALELDLPKGHVGVITSCATKALRRGIALASSRGSIDFTDMLWLTVILDCKHSEQFDIVMLDEAQDTNSVQRRMLKGLVSSKGRFVAVGDASQAIYGFAGASPNSLGIISDDWNAETLPLSISYRCPSSHVSLAHFATGAHIEPAPDARVGVLEEIGEAQLLKLAQAGDMVLCRTTAPLVAQCFAFLREGKPAKVKGREIGQGLIKLVKSIRTVEAYSPEVFGIALERYLGLKREELLKKARSPERAEAKIVALEDRVEMIQTVLEEKSPPSVEALIGELERLFDDRIPGVVLSTIHKAKGLEAERVFLMHPEKIPHPMARTVEQKKGETCVLFVALTRSKSELYFVGHFDTYHTWLERGQKLN